jgi:hypothetical protein
MLYLFENTDSFCLRHKNPVDSGISNVPDDSGIPVDTKCKIYEDNLINLREELNEDEELIHKVMGDYSEKYKDISKLKDLENNPKNFTHLDNAEKTIDSRIISTDENLKKFIVDSEYNVKWAMYQLRACQASEEIYTMPRGDYANCLETKKKFIDAVIKHRTDWRSIKPDYNRFKNCLNYFSK